MLRQYKESGKLPEHKKKEHELSEEAKQLRREQERKRFEVDVIREREALKNRAGSQSFVENIMEVFNLPRALMASFDFSAVLRQGLPLGIANPLKAVNAFKDMMKYGFNQNKADDFMASLLDSEHYGLAKKSKLYIAKPNAKLSAREELYASRLANKIPHVRISGNLYNIYLNSLRMQVFEGMTEKLLKEGYDPETENGKRLWEDMARFINNITGRGTLIGLTNETNASVGAFMSTVFFAPNYMISRFNILGNLLTGYGFYHPRVRRMALATLGSYIGTGWLILFLMDLAGLEVEYDPRSSDFGKIRVGDTRLDMWAGFSQVARILSLTATSTSKSIFTKEIVPLNQPGYMKPTVLDYWGRFVRGKFSPVAGIAADFASREKGVRKQVNWPGLSFEDEVYFQNVVGENMTVAEKAINSVVPLVFSDMVDIYENQGVVTMLSLLPLSLLGVGTQYIPPKTKAKLVDEMSKDEKKKDELFDATMDDINLDDIPVDTKMDLGNDVVF